MRALVLSVTLAVLLALVSQMARAEDSPSYQWQRPQGTAQAILQMRGPQGSRQFTFATNQPVSIEASMLRGDGVYHWQLNYSPEVSAALQTLADQRRAAGDTTLPPGWPQAVPASNGILNVQGGQFTAVDLEPSPTQDSSVVPNDQVIADDLIVQGSACIGLDCVNNESFGFDTIRIKENNTRIKFEDTSTGTFPTTDWYLVANDSASGGASYFSIQDVDAAKTPFLVEAGSPTDALRIADDGKIGFGTATPALNLHVVDGNTPGLRLEQSGASGFTPQTWDVSGNEANFFIRDTTNSSRLVFRIRPGAPTSSIDVAASGNVGLGNASPIAALNIRRPTTFTDNLLMVDAPDDGDPLTEDRRLALDSSGNLFVGGTITQLSSKFSKENLVTVAGSALLDRLRNLDLWTWNYRTSTSADRHLGPVAEDFFHSFGLGVSERSIAPADMAGVALAASKALTAEIDQRDQHISQLEARIARLEAALEKLSDAKQ